MILVIAGMANLNAYAIDGFSMDLGYGEESAVHIGTSAKWNWDSKWFTAGTGPWGVTGKWVLLTGTARVASIAMGRSRWLVLHLFFASLLCLPLRPVALIDVQLSQ